MLGVTESCIVNWELHRDEPEARHIPRIIRFISYYPYDPTAELVDRFRAVRRALGLTQEMLAEILKVDECSISSWERREHAPVKKSLEIIRSFLRCASYWDAKLNDQMSDYSG